MEQMTRRTAMAMGALPVLGAAAAYAGGQQWLRDDAGGRARFAPTNAGSARAALQQRHLPNVPLLTSDGDRVRFYDDLVKDRKVVLTFVSSRAPGFSVLGSPGRGAQRPASCIHGFGGGADG